MTHPVRTVFLGSGAFAVPIVSRLATLRGVDIVSVVTAPPRPRDRGQRFQPSPVGTWAAQAGVDVLTPPRLRAADAVAAIAGLAPELLVLADYGQIVPVELLDLPRNGALNLHPSLLPRHRGATPIAGAILSGDTETGVTLMRMDAGLDTGPIVAQVRTPIAHDETAPALEERLAAMAADLLATSIGGWLAGSLHAAAQPEIGATLTRPLHRGDGRLDASRTAAELERQVRAYQPWPGSYIETSAGRLIVWRASVDEAHAFGSAVGSPGTVVRTSDGGIGFQSADAILRLEEVQLAGGRRMRGTDLVRGRPQVVAAV